VQFEAGKARQVNIENKACGGVMSVGTQERLRGSESRYRKPRGFKEALDGLIHFWIVVHHHNRLVLFWHSGPLNERLVSWHK